MYCMNSISYFSIRMTIKSKKIYHTIFPFPLLMTTNNLLKKTHLDLKYSDLAVIPANSRFPASRLQHQITIPQSTMKTHKKTRKYGEKSIIIKKTEIPNDTIINRTVPDDHKKCEGYDLEQSYQKYLNQEEIKYLLMNTKSIWNESHKKYEEERVRLHQQAHIMDRNNGNYNENKKFETLNQEIGKFEKAAQCISQHNQCVRRKLKLLQRRNQSYLDQLEIIKIKDNYKKISGFKIKDKNSTSAHISPHSPETPNSLLFDTESTTNVSILNSNAMAQLSKYMVDIQDEASRIRVQTNDFIEPQDKTRKTMLKNVEQWKLDPPKKSHNSLKGSKVAYQQCHRDNKSRLKENSKKLYNFYEGLYSQIKFSKSNSQLNCKQDSKGSISSTGRNNPILGDQQKRMETDQIKVTNLKKVIIKNNIDKKVSQCLKKHNLRVPGFIKSIR